MHTLDDFKKKVGSRLPGITKWISSWMTIAEFCFLDEDRLCYRAKFPLIAPSNRGESDPLSGSRVGQTPSEFALQICSILGGNVKRKAVSRQSVSQRKSRGEQLTENLWT